jgi:hypothetical protein
MLYSRKVAKVDKCFGADSDQEIIIYINKYVSGRSGVGLEVTSGQE